MQNRAMAAVALVFVCIIGCSPQTKERSVTTSSQGQKSEAPAGTAAARDDAALVRFINADAKAGRFDIWSGDMRTFSDIMYKAITPYVEVPAHAGRFVLRQAGGTKDVAVSLREVLPGRHYTLVALPRGDGSSRLVVIADYLAALEPGKATVRLVNASTDITDLDLYIAGSPTRIEHGVPPSVAASSAAVKPVALDIRQEGQPAYQKLSNVRVEADRLYTFVVSGTPESPDLLQIVDRVEQK